MSLISILGKSKFRVLMDSSSGTLRTTTSEPATTTLSTQAVSTVSPPRIRSTEGKPFIYIPPTSNPPSEDAEETLYSMAREENRTISVPRAGASRDRLTVVNEAFDAGRLGSIGGPSALRNDRTTPQVGVRPVQPPEIRSGIVRNITVADPPLPDPTAISDDFTFDVTDDDVVVRAKFEEIGEWWTGAKPLPSEKTRIVAILSEDILYGFPRKSVLFIRKFISDRGIPQSYSILRKKIFEETAFREIATITNFNQPIPKKYNEIVSEFPYPNNQIMVFEDGEIENNNVYIYRVGVKWRLATTTEANELKTIRVGGSTSGAGLVDKVRGIFGS